MKTKAEPTTELPLILQRLQQFTDRLGLTLYQVNKEAGLCKGLLINAYSKHQGLTTNTLEAILNAYPQLNANWLICGRGDMIIPAANDALPDPDLTRRHLQDLDQLQQQAIALIRTIQDLKQREQADADARLLESLH